MKNKTLTLLACAGVIAGAMSLIKAEPVHAQTTIQTGATFVTNDNTPALRAAYSTVSIGGAAHSVALEVIYPQGVTLEGPYQLDLTWQNDPTGILGAPDSNNTLLTQALLDPGTINSNAVLANAAFVDAVSLAIATATGQNNYPAVGLILEKFVGPNGATVTLD
jgi:hypothetical protein